MPHDELKAVSDRIRDALHGAAFAFRGHQLAADEEYRKVKWRRRKDHRLIECWRNAGESGRGKYVFIVTKPTFEQIIQYIEDAGGYSAEEVMRVLYAMYYDGANFIETEPQVTRKTVARQLKNAFRGLNIFIGDWKQPSLWTIKISHKLLKDAEEIDFDLSDWFLVV